MCVWRGVDRLFGLSAEGVKELCSGLRLKQRAPLCKGFAKLPWVMGSWNLIRKTETQVVQKGFRKTRCGMGAGAKLGHRVQSLDHGKGDQKHQ